MYEVPSKKKMKELCERICKVIPEYKAAFPEIDLDTVSCNLYDLKILSPISSFSNAFIDESNVFNWDEKQMELNDFAMDTEDIYTTTFYHEMVHACQICCDCYNNGEEWRVGIGNDYEDMDINSLSWYWLIEASAEKVESDYLNVGYSTYTMYIGYLTSLDYVAQLDAGVDANMLERINFNHDMEMVFDMFDVKSEEERLEFIKMMYTIEVLQMSPDGFYDAYKEKYNVDLHSDDDIEAEFRLKLKDDALLSMTKLFYRNLARQINNGDATLQDMYYLIKVWENKLCYHFSNNEYGHMVAFKELYNQYLDIQNEFYELIAKDNNYTVEEIDTGLQGYSVNIKDGDQKKSPNCDLYFFNDDKKQFIKDFIAEYYWTGRPSIKECVDLAKQTEEEMSNYNQ